MTAFRRGLAPLGDFGPYIVPLTVAWTLGDIFLGIVILPNLVACVLLTGKVKEITRSYFERRLWLEERKSRAPAPPS